MYSSSPPYVLHAHACIMAKDIILVFLSLMSDIYFSVMRKEKVSFTAVKSSK
jgi:hypothetical protein